MSASEQKPNVSFGRGGPSGTDVPDDYNNNISTTLRRTVIL